MSESLLGWAKEAKNKKYVILILLIIVLMIGLTFFPTGGKPEQTKNTVTRMTQKSEPTSYEDKLEEKLKAMLSKMEGVGAVEVMITTYSTEEKILAEDVTASNQDTDEKDQGGGTRQTKHTQNNTSVVMQNGNVPYITREDAPEIKGVFILAQGASQSEVKVQIVEAVSRALDVPVHKISVEKKKD